MPVVLVLSLAVFSGPVPATPVPVEAQPAAGQKAPTHEDKDGAPQPGKVCTPPQLPKGSSDESAAGVRDEAPAVDAGLPLDPPAPPCPSTREARRASAPAVLPSVCLPASRPAKQEAGTPKHAEAQDISDPVNLPHNEPQTEKPPTDKEAAQVGEGTPEGESAEAQTPVTAPDLAMLCKEPAPEEPATPTGQACAGPASVSQSPLAVPTNSSPARRRGRQPDSVADQEPPRKGQRASASAETQSFDADSLLQTASCTAAPELPKANAAAAEAGGSSTCCSSKNSRPQKKSAPQEGHGTNITAPSSRKLQQLQESMSKVLPVNNSAAVPHQRQHGKGKGAVSGEADAQGHNLHSQASMWLDTPLNGGDSEGQDTPFAHEQCYPQKPQQGPPPSSAAAEHDAFGPLLGTIFGADVGADPMAIDDEDMALFDTDLANAWHHEPADTRWVQASSIFTS